MNENPLYEWISHRVKVSAAARNERLGLIDIATIILYKSKSIRLFQEFSRGVTNRILLKSFTCAREPIIRWWVTLNPAIEPLINVNKLPRWYVRHYGRCLCGECLL